jgi:molybdate transport system permease protein
VNGTSSGTVTTRGSPLPAVLAGLGALAAAMLVLPLAGLVLRAPWATFLQEVSSPTVRSAMRLSLLSSLAALALATLLGVPLAWLLARRDFPGKHLLRAVCVLPMVLPPVVAGVALLLAFGRRGVVGRPLADLTGVTLPFSLAGTVLAATFVAMPFLVITVESGLRAADPRYEEAAATLGAHRWTVFRRVTLPLVGPSLAAGMALCWARALGEFGATITFAGNLPGRTQTMPLAVYLALETNPGTAYVLSLLLAGVSVAVLVLLRGRFLSAS